MKDSTRNLIVGLTVLVALGIMAGMALVFRELPAFLQPGYIVKVHFPDAGGVQSGADVWMVGIRIGHVSAVQYLNSADPTQGVVFTAVIKRDVTIPGAANAYTASGGPLGGGASLDFRADNQPPGRDRKDAGGQPLTWLPKDGSAYLEGAREGGAGGGSQFIPPDLLNDLREAMGSIKRLANSLESFLAPPEEAAAPAPGVAVATSGPAGSQPARYKPNLAVTLAKFDAALDSVNKVLGDKENQVNIKQGLQQFRDAAVSTHEAMTSLQKLLEPARETLVSISEAADTAKQQFKDIGGKLVDDADRMGKLISELNRIAIKMEQGEGTAAKLLNDPALYTHMVDAASQLKNTLTQLQVLLEQWKKQGLGIKLK